MFPAYFHCANQRRYRKGEFLRKFDEFLDFFEKWRALAAGNCL